MKSTKKFTSMMSEVNKIGRSYGFRNGSHWAEKAVRVQEIDEKMFYQFKHCSELFVKLHGISSGDYSLSDELLKSVTNYKNCIEKSLLRNQRKQKPKLPHGTYRTFTKVFHWKGIDGEHYDFRFAIYNEGSDYSPSYKIDIKDAPHFSETQNDPHRFHILGAYSEEPYICWDSTITAFDKANAVMIVWAQNYKKELDFDKRQNGYGPQQKKNASRKRFLPRGTFRGEEKISDENPSDKSAFEEKTIYIDKKVLRDILQILGTKKPELGGMLGFSEEQDLITDFVFDKKAKVNSVEYNPNTKFLDSVINGQWNKKNVFLAGFVHSHPGHFNRLSSADVEYAAKICKEFDIEYLFMPIVTSSTDSETSITGYIVTEDEHVLNCNIEEMDLSIREEIHEADVSEEFFREAQTELEAMNKNPKSVLNPLSQDETFARISTTIPLDYMKGCTIIGVGCGGSRGFYEDMARCGVGKFILIDGDTSSRSNIASQNGYISEIGKNKASVVAGRLSDINEHLPVIAISQMLDDSLSDEDFENLLHVLKCEPEKTLICAFTDSFSAQARCQKLAKKLGIPLLAAQHHANGDSSEIIYWYPGVSKYSQEDILADRYEAYANGFKNDVTSVGSPIFNTTRLNALCEKIATGILLYKADVDSRYTSFLKYNADRNLILIRQKCLDFSDSTLDELFNHGDRDHFDDVVWLNPEEIF